MAPYDGVLRMSFHRAGNLRGEALVSAWAAVILDSQSHSSITFCNNLDLKNLVLVLQTTPFPRVHIQNLMLLKKFTESLLE
jgi:3-polyprenyl-4-hydroxybenzoate decarboxylase